ncbi:hypothetical protein KM043_012381 [Ampulex compressa]|nr:hypothetical protein KM043_012381 [Ampulex compressa]
MREKIGGISDTVKRLKEKEIEKEEECEMERNEVMRKREERKKNVVMKEVEVKEGKRGEKEMLVARLQTEEQKWEMMEKKKQLRGIKRIQEDLAWKERRVWVREDRIRIGAIWLK